MKLGIVGTGQIGTILARTFSAGGHEVHVANSRGPETIDAAVLEFGAQALPAQEEAVRDKDVIILSVPFTRIPGLAELLAPTARCRLKEHLSRSLSREATVAELAAELSISEEEVIDGVVAANGYTAGSIDFPLGGPEQDDADSTTYADITGDYDPGMELVEDLHALAPLLEALDERDRQIIELRFGREVTQAQIGEYLGLSQMHVSRLLSRILAKLREGMLTD